LITLRLKEGGARRPYLQGGKGSGNRHSYNRGEDTKSNGGVRIFRSEEPIGPGLTGDSKYCKEMVREGERGGRASKKGKRGSFKAEHVSQGQSLGQKVGGKRRAGEEIGENVRLTCVEMGEIETSGEGGREK